MDFTTLDLAYRFSGLAGTLQTRKATASLVRELGDNYGRYHGELSQALSALDRLPQGSLDKDGLEGYLRWHQAAQDIVIAEVALRRCRRARLEGGSLKQADAGEAPLIDSDYRLIDVETGQPVPGGKALRGASRPGAAGIPDAWSR